MRPSIADQMDVPSSRSDPHRPDHPDGSRSSRDTGDSGKPPSSAMDPSHHRSQTLETAN